MPKNTGFVCYGVIRGKVPGVYLDWLSTKEQIHGFPRSYQRKFKSIEEARGVVSRETRIPLDRVPVFVKRVRDEITKSGIQSNVDRNASLGIPENAIVVYTDGACPSNGIKGAAVAGIGVYWGPDDPRNISARLPGRQSNQRAELYAILRALETLCQIEILEDSPKQTCYILTDSKWVYDGLTSWFWKWQQNGFKSSSGQLIEHVDLWKRCLNILHELGTRRQGKLEVLFKHIPGHSGISGNEEADRLAVEGAKMPPASSDEEIKQDYVALDSKFGGIIDGTSSGERSIREDSLEFEDEELEAEMLKATY